MLAPARFSRHVFPTSARTYRATTWHGDHSLTYRGCRRPCSNLAKRVSTPEATAFDLVRHVAPAGHLSNVATVLVELGESIVPDRLQAMARSSWVPDVQRLGYLLDLVQLSALADRLAEVLATRSRRRVPLHPGLQDPGVDVERRFRVAPNVTVEPDL